ncbi:MAG: hypothetical protein AB1480_00025 [Nitrospirota bacterium]
MKKKSLLTVIAMLSVFLFGIGTAYAVLGVNDAVPGEDFMFPFMCGKDAGNTMNTLWAVAEKSDGDHFPDSEDVVCAYLDVYNKHSVWVYDAKVCWTKYDVYVDDCQSLVALMSDSQKALITESIEGGSITRDYYAGYVQFTGQDVPDTESVEQRFVPWVYLVDLPKGFASGFNGITSEYGLGWEMGEDYDYAPVTASSFYPRYFLLNDKTETWNWWIVLAGRNEYAYVDPVFWNLKRYLGCYFCNEEEDCISIPVPIPHELNIINVTHYLPPALHTDFPKGGFGRCYVEEYGTYYGVPTWIYGSVDIDNLIPDTVNGFYSMYAWAYQRVESDIDAPSLSWDVIHEMHREYCDLFDVLLYDTSLGLGLYLDYVTGDTADYCYWYSD